MGSQGDMPRPFLYSTMHQAIESVQMTHSQLETCQKVHNFFFQCFLFSIPTGPKNGWTPHAGGPCMRSGKLPTGEDQLFYYPDDHPSMPGWFKGMEQILHERGLWPEEGLPVQCPGFKCPPGRADCCCRRALFLQPDFTGQCSQLEELIESRGHLCEFYPKYHCELNFIEQYWGAAKAQYRMAPRAKTTQEMEKTVKECLDSVPLPQIRQLVFLPSSGSSLARSLTLITHLHHTGSQIGLRISFLPTRGGFQVHKPHGQIGSTMGIECYHPRLFSKPWMPSAASRVT
jgi:hypothetical protein